MSAGARAVPPPLRALLARLPQRPPGLAVSFVLNALLCAGLLSHEALAPLRGRVIGIEAADAGIRVRLRYRGPDGFDALSPAAPADATIRAALGDFVSLALRREDPDALFFTRRLVIEGDTDLGLVAKNALDAVDWTRVVPSALRNRA